MAGEGQEPQCEGHRGEFELPACPTFERPVAAPCAGFLADAGEFEVWLRSSVGRPCACCKAHAAVDAGREVLATLSASGTSMGFWAQDESQPHAWASMCDLNLDFAGDAVLGALHELSSKKKVIALGRAAPASPSTGGCTHVVTFTVHLGHCFFNGRQSARDLASARCLRVLLSRFISPWPAQEPKAVEMHEISCMRAAARSLGLAVGADPRTGMNALLDAQLPHDQAQQLRSKFRLDRVLESILQPSSSRPGPCADESLIHRPFRRHAQREKNQGACAKAEQDLQEDAHLVSVASCGRGLSVHTLPEETLIQMLELLEPVQLATVSMVCGSLHAAAWLCVPGLKLQLYRHQRRAMEWMMTRERQPQRIWNPEVTRFTSRAGSEFFFSSKPGSAVLTWEPHTLQELDDVKGGLLCDEPGMGKTITVLSLVLKTRRRAPLGVDAGTSSSNALQQASSTRSAVAYPRQVKREHSSDEDQDADSCNHLPVHLQKKRFRIFLGPNPKTGASGPSFTWHPTSSTQSPSTTRGCSTPPSTRVPVPLQTAGGALTSPAAARPQLMSTPLPPPSTRRARAADSTPATGLYTSCATLIVVPATLIDHWRHQITEHTRAGALRVLQVAKNSDMLPAAQMLDFDVVLTTFDVLSKEWAIASPAPGSTRWYHLHGMAGRGSQSWRFSPDYKGVSEAHARQRNSSFSPVDTARSELLQVRWQRVVLDEGHVMGASCETNRALMLASIVAGAKWICTGTPAPSTPAAELQHMYGLVAALGVKPYANLETWRSLIHAPFETLDASAWVRLHVLLQRIMTRSVKADMERLGEIPACQTVTTELQLSLSEKKAYNGLMTVIKRNLVLAECGGSRVDSLLYRTNRKYALEAINNARKACCVTGQFNLEIVRAHLDECILDMRRGHSLHEADCQCNGSYFDVPTLKQKHHNTRTGECPLLADRSRVVPEHRVRVVEDAFAGVGQSGGTRAVVNTVDGHIACDKCARLSVFPFITPCAHMICMECTDHAATSQCPVCDMRYSHGRFAHFQPSVENPRMEWNANWIDQVSTKVALLLTRLRGYGFFGKLPVNESWWANVVQRRVRHRALKVPQSSGSSSVVSNRVGKTGKCIIFSNFIEAIDSVTWSLSEALHGVGIYMRFTANVKGGMRERIAALQSFRDDPDICILLLDGVGALGLDLSFVSHIFLLDPIWDKSLEDQVNMIQ